jgi:hypothetical protein
MAPFPAVICGIAAAERRSAFSPRDSNRRKISLFQYINRSFLFGLDKPNHL